MILLILSIVSFENFCFFKQPLADLAVVANLKKLLGFSEKTVSKESCLDNHIRGNPVINMINFLKSATLEKEINFVCQQKQKIAMKHFPLKPS